MLLSSNKPRYKIVLWDTKTGATVKVLSENVLGIESFNFSPDGRTLLCTTGREGLLWNVQTGVIERRFPGLRWPSAYASDGMRLAACAGSGIIVMDASTGAQTRALALPEAESAIPTTFTSVAFSPDGRRIAAGDNCSVVRLWNTESGSHLLTYRGHANAGRMFMPGQQYATVVSFVNQTEVASAADEAIIRIWDSETGKDVRTIPPASSNLIVRPPRYPGLPPVAPRVRRFVEGPSHPTVNEIVLRAGEDLKYFKETPKGRLASWVPLRDQPCETLAKEPKYKSRRVLYGCLILGNSEDNRFSYAIDAPERGGSVLYLDKNNNQDLTDDGPPCEVEHANDWFSSIDLSVPVVLLSKGTG